MIESKQFILFVLLQYIFVCFFHYDEDNTASLFKCSTNTCKLTSSVKITGPSASDPQAYILLCVWLGFTIERKKRAWLPMCSVFTYRGTRNLVRKISWASSTGACNNSLKFSCDGSFWYPCLTRAHIVSPWNMRIRKNVSNKSIQSGHILVESSNTGSGGLWNE